MKLVQENEVTAEVAGLMRLWAPSLRNCGVVARMGGWFDYWSEISRRGGFVLHDGRIAVLEPAEVRLAMLAADKD